MFDFSGFNYFTNNLEQLPPVISLETKTIILLIKQIKSFVKYPNIIVSEFSRFCNVAHFDLIKHFTF